MRHALTKEALASSQSIGRIAVERLPVREEKAKKPLQILLGTYDAVYKLTKHHDASVHVAASEALAYAREKPVQKAYAYPLDAQGLAKHIDYTPGEIAGYLGSLVQRSQSLAHSCNIEALSIADRTYVLAKKISQVQLVGLQKEQDMLTLYMEQLFLYDNERMLNADTGRFPRVIMLKGPAGTGKTSLIKHCLSEAERLKRISSTPFHFESFDAANFSSYFGKSSRIAKQKLQRVKDPRGVGLFVIEDVDMVLQNRDDQNVYHGVLQVQQCIMNEMSGLEPHYGNTITILTTNKPQKIDDAMRDRIAAVYDINPFEHLNTHEAYFAMAASHLSKQEQQRLSAVSHRHGLSGRDMAAVITNALAATTRRPTEGELRTHTRAQDAYGTVTAELLETFIADRSRKT